MTGEGGIVRARYAYILPITLLVGGVSLFAQSIPPPPPPDPLPAQSAAPALRVTSRIVQVSVSVHDENGLPIRGLTKDDFVLMDDGQRQQIASLSEQTNRLTTTA